MNTWYKILFSLILSSTCLFVADRIISNGTKKFYVHNYEKLENIFDSSTDYDIVFIGSSRMHNSINPRIIDSITGLSAYNAGIDGAGLPELKMIFEAYLLKHSTPKKIFLSVDADAFDDIYKFYNHILYLHFLKNKIVDTTLYRNGYAVLIYKLFPFLRLTEMDDRSKRNAIAGLSGQNELSDEAFQYKGYLSNGNTCIYPSLDAIYEHEKYKIDRKSVAMLNSIINECKKKQIELILIYTPEYNYRLQGYIRNFNEIINVADSIASKNNLLFFRDDKLEMCREKCFFANYGHLNTAGATEYSILLGRRIRDSILQE
jgi:hypothetical protein